MTPSGPPLAGARLEALREDARPVRLAIELDRTYVIGRGDDADLRLPAEPNLSRRHFRARLEKGRLQIEKLPGASNPVFYQGEPRDVFQLRPGEQFVVGGTRFAFQTDGVPDERAPDEQRTLLVADVHGAAPDAERLRLLDLLELPELMRNKSEPEFFLHVATMLRLASRGSWARIATEEGRRLAEDDSQELAGPRDWSRTLVARAVAESPCPTWCRWDGDAGASARPGVDWAVAAAACVPGEPKIVFYVAGAGPETSKGALEETARLVGLIVDMVGRTLAVRRLESRERRFERFFSRPVIDKIMESAASPEALEPRLAQSTIMFFDIRGFSKKTEGKNDRILEHIGELRRALTAMTEEIFREHGVVLLYMGDGILACWNVPLPDERHVDRAARAALAMSRRLGEVSDGWRCGIGLHTGEVVAGAIGSDQLFVYSVLGAVVNQASRIEGITKFVEAPILVSREVAQRISPEVASVVRVGRFQPAGMEAAMDLFELVPPPGDTARAGVLSRGLAALEAGEWENAYEILNDLPAKDLPARFLKSLAEQHRRHPPKNWKGIIELSEK